MTDDSSTVAEMRRAAAILEVAAAAAAEILNRPRWEEALAAMLSRLGEATGSARVEVGQWPGGNGGDHRLCRRWRWARGQAFEWETLADREPPVTDPDHWKEELAQRQWILLSRDDEGGGVRAGLDAPGRCPVAVVPIRAADGPWGRLVVVGAQDGMGWTEREASALVAVADVLGAGVGSRQGRQLALYLEQAVETLNVGVTVRDSEGRILYANPAEAAMHGYTLEEMSELSARQLAPEQYWRVERRPDSSWLLGWQRERLNRRKDGSIFPVQLTSVALRDDDDKPVAVATICEDISDRKQIEEALRRSEEHYRGLFHAAKDAIIVLDPDDYLVLDVNPRACQVYGYGRAELVGMSLRAICRDFARERDHIGEVLEREPGHSFETIHRAKDGVELVLEVTASVLQQGGRDVILSINRDISERKLAEEALETSREQLRNLAEHLQTAREEERMAVARTIHDELGEVLTALKMDVAWVGARLPETVERGRDKIAGMTALIDQGVATVQRLSTELRPSILDDLGLQAATEWYVKDFAARTGIECRLELADPELELDRHRSTALFRILQEALTNVARHAGAGRVAVRLGPDDGAVELSVRDNGKGIGRDAVRSHRSFGLLGIRERTAVLGGEAVIARLPDGGTEVLARIPLPAESGGVHDQGVDL